MQVETAIDSWRQWDLELTKRPVPLETLNDGRSNRSFLLQSGDHRMVLRLNGESSNLPGADRSHECAIWLAASANGIAPPLLHVDEQHRFLVSTYIESSLPANHESDERVVELAFGLLKRCHQIDVEAPSIDYSSHIEYYWECIDSKDEMPNPRLLEQREPMQRLAQQITNSGAPMGICHHDPVMENFVGTPERLYLIDWEYAMHGMQIMDFAAMSIEWEIDDDFIIDQTGSDIEQLIRAKALYKYLCELWEEVAA